MRAYIVYGSKDGELKTVGSSNSYWEAVQIKEKARRKGKYDKLVLKEKVGKSQREAYRDLGLKFGDNMIFN